MSREEDRERQPLLAGQRQDESSPPTGGVKGLVNKLKDRWHIYKILAVTLLMYTSTIGPYAALLDLSRALACAEYYQRFPDANQQGLLDSTASNKDQRGVCDNAWIERSSARAISTMEICGSLCATLAIFFIQPRMQRWGPKRILLVSVGFLLLDRTANLFWPLGYPFRPMDAPMTLSAITVRRLFVAVTCLANVAGGELVPLMCLRLIITKASTASDRTANMVSLQLMNLIGVSVAPTLTVGLGSLFPFSSTRTDRMLLRLGHYLQHLCASNTILASLFTSTPPVVVPPTQRADPTNVAPYLVSLMTVIITLICIVTLLPSEQTQADSADQDASPSSSVKSSNSESMFYRVWPHRDIDGHRDWRIVLICLTTMSYLATAYSLMIFLQFCGHALHWGQESVALLVSVLGVSRVVCLLGIVPLATAYFQRTTTRPTILRGLSLEEIKAISQHVPADEPPIESAFEVPGDPSDEVRGAVTTWQAMVDRGVLRFSLIADIIGWFLTAVFTATGNAVMIAVSGCISALGAAAMPVRMSIDLVIVQDVIARSVERTGSQGPETTEEEHNSQHQRPSQQSQAYAQELYFALVGFFSSFITILTPILDTWIYGMTLDTYPAINWLVACFFFLITYVLHFSMSIHHRRAQQ